MYLERASSRWWTLIVRGILAIGFGILAITVPGAALTALVFLFGFYAMADGLSSLSLLLSPRAEGGWLLGLAGVLSIAAGAFAIAWPGLTAVALFYVIATWAIVIGVAELIGAIAYSREIESEWAFVLSGLLWIAFGIIVVIWPGIGVLAVLALIATVAVLSGVLLIIVGARLKRLHDTIGRTVHLRE